MNKTVLCGEREGKISAKASKSVAHRTLICAALSGDCSDIKIDGISEDIISTINCLNGMGADIKISGNLISIKPVELKNLSENKKLYCKESGSTLRFLLPLCGALGLEGTFYMEGRLAERPHKIFADILCIHGMNIEQEGNLLKFKGKLTPGKFEIPGNISSQYISGLLFSLPLLERESEIIIKGDIGSEDYIRLTEESLVNAKIEFEKKEKAYRIFGNQKYKMAGVQSIEGDWSNAAVFLCAGALSKEGITVTGLNINSKQGDRGIIDILINFGAKVDVSENSVTVKRGNLKGIEIDAQNIPDIVPALSVVGACAKGITKIFNTQRLKLKESDRLKGTESILKKMGADIKTDKGIITINGKKTLNGGKVSSYSDHRMAMMAALAACVCSDDVIIDNAACVKKSYPGFWDDFGSLNII